MERRPRTWPTSSWSEWTAASRLASRPPGRRTRRSMVAQLHVVTAVDKATVEEIPDRPGATQITSGEVAEAIAAEVAAELEASSRRHQHSAAREACRRPRGGGGAAGRQADRGRQPSRPGSRADPRQRGFQRGGARALRRLHRQDRLSEGPERARGVTGLVPASGGRCCRTMQFVIFIVRPVISYQALALNATPASWASSSLRTLSSRCARASLWAVPSTATANGRSSWPARCCSSRRWRSCCSRRDLALARRWQALPSASAQLLMIVASQTVIARGVDAERRDRRFATFTLMTSITSSPPRPLPVSSCSSGAGRRGTRSRPPTSRMPCAWPPSVSGAAAVARAPARAPCATARHHCPKVAVLPS